MTPELVEEIVARDLADFEAAPPAPRVTIGKPWPSKKIRDSVAALRASLVKPYRQRVLLKDTVGQMRRSPPAVAEYWVVAESAHHLEFYDPVTRKYGLAMAGRAGNLPETIGVQGDLVGVFGAM